MADFKGGVLTNLGKALAAKVEAGKCKLQFTKMKVGDGTPSSIELMTDLASPKKVLDISAVTPDPNGRCDVESVLINADLEKGFYLKEIGLFASDPDAGEILYCVATAGDADYIQAKGGATVLSIALHMTIAIKSVDDVVTDVDTKGLITASDLANHDKSETAHKNLLQVTVTADKPTSMSDRGLWVEIKSGLKAILHRWNKTTKTYDTIHPETETSQITDFDTAVNGKINAHNTSGAAHSTLFNQCEKTSSLANDIVTKLAQTTTISVISALQTNSWFGQLLKLLLNASGMKYLIAQNGYICFGSLFGGLILQWGIINQDPTNTEVSRKITMPLSSNAFLMGTCASETYSCNTAIGPNNRSGSSFTYRQQVWTTGSISTDWIALCK